MESAKGSKARDGFGRSGRTCEAAWRHAHALESDALDGHHDVPCRQTSCGDKSCIIVTYRIAPGLRIAASGKEHRGGTFGMCVDESLTSFSLVTLATFVRLSKKQT